MFHPCPSLGACAASFWGHHRLYYARQLLKWEFKQAALKNCLLQVRPMKMTYHFTWLSDLCRKPGLLRNNCNPNNRTSLFFSAIDPAWFSAWSQEGTAILARLFGAPALIDISHFPPAALLHSPLPLNVNMNSFIVFATLVSNVFCCTCCTCIFPFHDCRYLQLVDLPQNTPCISTFAYYDDREILQNTPCTCAFAAGVHTTLCWPQLSYTCRTYILLFVWVYLGNTYVHPRQYNNQHCNEGILI